MCFSFGGGILGIIKVNNLQFSYKQIIKPKNKRVYLRVKNNELVFTSPVLLNDKYLETMILQNFNYITKYMHAQEKTEDKIHFLGKEYMLKIISGANNVYIQDDFFIVQTDNLNLVKKLVKSFYNSALEKIVKKYEEEILNIFGLKKVIFHYKDVKSYYGCCYNKKRLIVLATKLAKYDLIYILSVIYHECAHFKYQNHQKEFYDYLERFFPNYKSYQKNLRRIKYNDKY